MVLLVLLVTFIVARTIVKQNKQKSHIEKVDEEFNPIFDKMDDVIESSEPEYDIEKTIRVMNGLDIAAQEEENFDDFLLYMAQQDYTGVAPEVIEARKKLLKIYKDLYEKQVEYDEQQEFWKLTQDYSNIVINHAGELTEGVGMSNPLKITSVTIETMQDALNKMEEQQGVNKKLKKDIAEIKSDLVEYMYDYSQVYYKYLSEWDEICIHRDMAYLAMNSGDLNAMEESVDRVLELNPNDREGQILKAVAMIESSSAPNNFVEVPQQPGEVLDLLDQYIEDDPSRTAPAFLLKGVYYAKQGQFDKAKLNFEEAAVYYPKQSEELTDMLNPYKMRSFLRKTREGNFIVELYKASMLGAGYFSPDLQLAKIYFDNGDFDKGKEKVLDHFSRRRNQDQWDYIISDINFCKTMMEDDFNKIFPEDSYLDLKADVTTFGGKVNVKVNNRSDVKLTNASLILCVQFTDMHREDYQTFKMENTLPAVEPNKTNDFGSIEIKHDLFGKEKTHKDIVNSRAVLVSNEAIAWIDSDEFKYKTVKDGSTDENMDKQQVYNEDYLESVNLTPGNIRSLFSNDSRVTVEENMLGKDEVKIQIPRKLAILKPFFRLRDESGEIVIPNTNVIVNDNIELVYKTNVDESTDEITMDFESKFINGQVVWTGNIEKGFSFKTIRFN